MQIQDDKKFNNILKLFKNEGGNETTGTQTYGWTATKQNKNNMSTLFRNQHKKGGASKCKRLQILTPICILLKR